jgi:hypothetical protein
MPFSTHILFRRRRHPASASLTALLSTKPAVPHKLRRVAANRAEFDAVAFDPVSILWV